MRWLTSLQYSSKPPSSESAMRSAPRPQPSQWTSGKRPSARKPLADQDVLQHAGHTRASASPLASARGPTCNDTVDGVDAGTLMLFRAAYRADGIAATPCTLVEAS